MSSEPVIETRGLGKAYAVYRRPEDRLKQILWGHRRRFYEEFWALRDIDLTVGRGETLGIIGRNGSGKSTLLQMICGTLRPSAGDVHARGRVAALLELGSGFNPQFTGRENVALGAAVLGLSATESADRFDEIAAFADIGDFMDQPMKHYSSGMYARLAFSLCAHVDADVLIVDEILAVGDASFQQKCMRYLNRFRTRGTLLFVSHDSGAAVKLCDRALWLEQGEARGLGDAKEMCRRYLAAQAEEMMDEKGGFRLTRTVDRPKPLPAEIPPIQNAGPADSSEVFLFDADGDWPGRNGLLVESAVFHATDGAPLHVASGGEDVELRIVCRSENAIERPVIAFTVRDRLGQVLFADDTFATYRAAPPPIGPNGRFMAKFAFSLPYLANGSYVIEAFLFEGVAGDFVPLDRRQSRQILYVQSRHPSNGLVNVAMRAVSLAATDAMTIHPERGLLQDASLGIALTGRR
jgi:lipopolysaccharide transport system ATP-binding protein